jgi:hypothetical protein
VGGVIFYAVRVVSKKSRRLVLSIISCYFLLRQHSYLYIDTAYTIHFLHVSTFGQCREGQQMSWRCLQIVLIPLISYIMILPTLRQLSVCWRGALSLTRRRVCWPSSAQSLLGPSAVGLATIFYGLRFDTSLCVASTLDYIASARTAQRTALPTAPVLLRASVSAIT